MKRIKYLLIAAMALIATACDNYEPILDGKTGTLDLSAFTPSVDTSVTVITRSTDEPVDVSDYIVTLANSRGEIVNTWRYADMPQVVTLPVGDYTLSVTSHAAQAAEWDTPLYKGSVSATVKDGEIARPGAVVCTLGGAKVSVEYSAALKAALNGDYNVSVALSDDVKLDFRGAETRVGCFNLLPGGDASFVATFTGSVNSNPVTVTRAVTGVAAGNHYKLTFSLKSGTIDPSIVVDVTVTDEDVDINVGEDLPTITSQTLDLSGSTELTMENYESIIAVINIAAPKGISELHVQIISDLLTPEELAGIGLSDKFDLCNPGELDEVLQGLGFPTGDAVKGKTEIPFDITFFMSLLCYFPGDNNFRITVVDTEGNSVTQDVCFHVPNE